MVQAALCLERRNVVFTHDVTKKALVHLLEETVGVGGCLGFLVLRVAFLYKEKPHFIHGLECVSYANVVIEDKIVD